VVTSNKDGKTENCRGSVVNKVINSITSPMLMLNTSKTSRTAGGIGIMIISNIPMTMAAIIISVFLFRLSKTVVADRGGIIFLPGYCFQSVIR